MPVASEIVIQVARACAGLMQGALEREPDEVVFGRALETLLRVGGFSTGWIARLDRGAPAPTGPRILAGPHPTPARASGSASPDEDPTFSLWGEAAERAVRTGAFQEGSAAGLTKNFDGVPGPDARVCAWPLRDEAEESLGLVVLVLSSGTFDPESREQLAPLFETIELLMRTGEAGNASAGPEFGADRFFQLTPEPLAVAHVDGHFVRVNPAFERALGYSAEEICGRPFLELIHPDDRPGTLRAFERVIAGEPVLNHENRYFCKDGSVAWFSWRASESDGSGLIYCAARCITENKSVEGRLRENEALLRAVIESLPMDFWVVGLNGEFILHNSQFADHWGDLRGRTADDLDLPALAKDAWRQAHATAFGGRIYRGESSTEVAGRVRHFQTTVVPIREDGRVFGVAGFHVDITERKRSAELAQRAQERLDLALRGADLGMWDWDLRTGEIVINERWASMIGYTREEIEPDVRSRENMLHPDDMPWIRQLVIEHIKGKTPYFEIEHRMRAKDGGWIWVLDMGKVVERDDEGRALRAAGTHLDITERKRAETSLKLRERILRTIANASERFLKTSSWESEAEAFLRKLGEASDVSRVYLFQNAAEEGGASGGSLRFLWKSGDTPADPTMLEAMGTELVSEVWRAERGALEKGEVLSLQARNLPPDQAQALDSRHAQSVVLVPIIVSQTWWGVIGFDQCDHTREWSAADIDTLKLVAGVFGAAIQRREDEAARQKLEEGIRQAQKLESLGVLAGGIAHDFNNLLMGILGNASLAMTDLSAISPARSSLEQIEIAAQRAADLTRQLLAYSGKGRFVIQNLDLNRVVEDMRHLLEVSVSKKALLQLELNEPLPAVKADASQIRQIIMNLVSNASEALGDGSGTLKLTTGEVDLDRDSARHLVMGDVLEPGPYVFIEVSDTGSGMDPATMERIFDPFYTTKFTGRGLGLAAVLGIVRSHEGGVEVRSAPGEGTRFVIYFPAESAAAEAPPPPARRGSRGARGVVLVIDDEDTVRAVVERMLERAGYTVLTAADGVEGLDLFRMRSAEIDAVILDLLMPRMDGQQTFDALLQCRADLPVLVMSGFDEQEAADQFGRVAPGDFIQKPFGTEALLSKLAVLLPGPEPAE